MRPPAVVFAELKTETGSVRTEQHGWLSALRGCEGVEARLWRPRDWQEIEERSWCGEEGRTIYRKEKHEQ